MSSPEIKLITSRFCDARPDILILHELEEDCLAYSTWARGQGPLLFAPVKISTRLFTLLHTCLRPFLRRVKIDKVIVSLGLPYRHYLLGKIFPYFAVSPKLRVLWTYDVWEPRFKEIAAIVREADVDLLLLSSSQATEHFRALNRPGCEVHWVPESVATERYPSRLWSTRPIDVLAFGRSYPRYHEKILSGYRERNINYIFHRHLTANDFRNSLGNAKISICFPRSLTHPDLAGGISTVTLRYLESMAAKCLVLGQSPGEAEEMFGYNPVVDVDWNDPLGQIQDILAEPERYRNLIERNFAEVNTKHHVRNFVARMEKLIRERLAR